MSKKKKYITFVFEAEKDYENNICGQRFGPQSFQNIIYDSMLFRGADFEYGIYQFLARHNRNGCVTTQYNNIIHAFFVYFSGDRNNPSVIRNTRTDAVNFFQRCIRYLITCQNLSDFFQFFFFFCVQLIIFYEFELIITY